jgi:glutamate-1-semialdehyde 2,1-aminomutase
LAGTYNAHPIPTAAAIATIERLLDNNGEVYRHLEQLGHRLENGLNRILSGLGLTGTLARQGSAFCLYFCDHAPVDWHDIAKHQDFELDVTMRRRLIDKGIYFFPLAVKQGSISAAHTSADIDVTLERWGTVLTEIAPAKALEASAVENSLLQGD